MLLCQHTQIVPYPFNVLLDNLHLLLEQCGLLSHRFYVTKNPEHSAWKTLIDMLVKGNANYMHAGRDLKKKVKL